MANYRFIGSRAYTAAEKHYFFGRESLTERLFQTLIIEEVAILYGEAGSGKSSLLNAALVPLLENSGRFEIIQLDANKQNSGKSMPEQLKNICRERFTQICYLDKLLSERNDYWYYLKKIQAQTQKIIVLVLDNFDAIAGTKTERLFHNQIQHLITGTAPEKHRDTLESGRQNLSKKGEELLTAPIDLKMIWTAKPEAQKWFKGLENTYSFNPQNAALLNEMKTSKAISVFNKIAKFESVYKEQNNFETVPFVRDDALLENLFDEISGKTVKMSDLQIVGKKAEADAMQFKPDQAPTFGIISAQDCAQHYYDTDLRPLFAKNPDYRDFLLYLTRLPEDSSVVKSRLPQDFCKNFSGIVEARSNTDEDAVEFSFKSTFIKEQLPALIQEEKEAEQKTRQTDKRAKQENTDQAPDKYKKMLSYYRWISMFLVLLAAVGIIIINKARKNAQDNKQWALSNMYAAYSYKNSETDPTLSFRYAQKAYEHYPKNHEAYSALLNAYYSTEVFYSLLGTLPSNRTGAVISPNGEYVFASVSEAGGRNQTVALHTVAGKEIKAFNNDFPIFFIGFSKSSLKAVYGDVRGRFFIYDIADDALNRIQVADSRILHAELAGDLLLVLSEDNLSLHHTAWNETLVFPEYEFPYDMVCLSSSGTKIAAGSDRYVYLFSRQGDLISRFELPTGAGIKYPRITSIRFSPDEEKVLTVVNDMFTKASQIIVSSVQGETLFKYGGHREWVRTADFSADGTHIVSASYDHTSVVIDDKGNPLGILKGHKSFVSDAVFYQNNETVISVGEDANIKQWKFGRLLNPLAEIKDIDRAIFSPSGLKILTANDTQLSLRNIFGEQEVLFDTDGKKIRQTAFSYNESFVFGLADSREIFFWKPDGTLAYRLGSVPATGDFADYYADSSYVLSLKEDTLLLVRRLQTDEILHQISTNHKIHHACFRQSDGSVLTSEASGKLVLRKTDGELIKVFDGHRYDALKAVFSSDEKRILSTGADKTAKLWASKGQLLHTFPGYDSKINSAVFSPDDSFILIAGDDEKIRLYTAEGQFTGEISYPGKVQQAVFSADGDYIIALYSIFGKNTAKLQHISPEIILRYVNDDKVFGNIQEFDID